MATHRSAIKPHSRDALREMKLGGSDEYNIVITARPRGSLPAALWQSSYFAFCRTSLLPQTPPRSKHPLLCWQILQC